MLRPEPRKRGRIFSGMYSVREGGRVSLEARDAGAVVVALEGLEGAALAPVAVGAHQSVGASTVPAKSAPTHLSRPLLANGSPARIPSRSVRATSCVHLWLIWVTIWRKG